MTESPNKQTIPEPLRRVVTLLLTVVAALLYAGILGYAVASSALGQQVVLTEGAVKAARVLGGLVGAVVSAGFAGSWRLSTVPLSAEHPVGGRTATAWFSLGPASRFRSKLASLARTLGFAARPPIPLRAEPGAGGEPTTPETSRVAVAMALLYAGVYFLVGIAAFVLVLVKSEVPEVVDGSAWVWLGTVMASAYTYFGMDAQVAGR
jgi:hypothetical protein